MPEHYHKWLGIRPEEQPANHYRLLALTLFEDDLDTISCAADQRMAHVRSFQTGNHAAFSQQILNELATARVCLLNPQKKVEYDWQLRAKLTPKSPPAAPPAKSPVDVVPDMAFTPTYKKHKKPTPRWMPWAVVGVGGLVAVVLLMLIANSGREEQVVARAPAISKPLPPVPPKAEPKNVELPPKPAPQLEPEVEPKQQPLKPQVTLLEDPKPLPEVEPPKVDPKPEQPGAQAQPKPEEPPKARLPIPDPAAQQKSLATIRDIYKEDYKDKSALAKKLIQKAKETQDATDRFALLQEAKDLASENWQGELAFEAIDAMVREYDVSSPEMKAGVLEQAVKRPRLTPEQKTAIAEAALEVVDEAVAEDNFDVAKKAGKLANQLAHLLKNKELVQEVAAKGKQVVAAAKVYADTQEAMVTLKDKPDDPEANLIVGKYQCFNKGNWGKGLPMLAKGSDEKLKALAEKDIAGVDSANEQVKLGDAWWDMTKERASYWYEQALPGLTGLQKDRVTKRVAEPDSGDTSGSLGHANEARKPQGTQGGRTAFRNKAKDLLRLVDPTRDTVRGTWRQVAGQLAGTPGSMIVFPVKADGSYQLQLQFTRISGEDMGFVFPVGPNVVCQLFIDMFGVASGLSTIENGDPRLNKTKVNATGVVNGRPCTLDITVFVIDEANAEIQISLDGKPYVSWKGTPAGLTVSPLWRWPADVSFALGSGNTSVVFHKATLRISRPYKRASPGLEKDTAAPSEGRPAAGKWMVLFRSANPKIWNTAVRNGGEIAVPIANVPDRVKYLKMSCGDEYVIVPITKDKLLRPLTQAIIDEEGVGWFGDNKFGFDGYHLGIFNRAWNQMQAGVVKFGLTGPGQLDITGWGFGHLATWNKQGYCWAGKPIASTVFEVSVTTTHLTPAEQKALPGLAGEKAGIEKMVSTSPARGTDTLAAANGQKGDEIGSDHPHLTTSILKKKLHGKVAYDSKTGEFVLRYDWTSKRQLDDFDLTKAKPGLLRGVLALRPGDSIRHVVDFQAVKIAVPVLVPIMKGMIIQTSGGASARVGGANPDTMCLGDGHGESGLIVPDSQRKGIQQIRLTLERNRLAFAYGNGNSPSQLGRPVTDFHAGQVELFGGEVGFQYGVLVFAGTLDKEWVAKLLSDSESKN